MLIGDGIHAFMKAESREWHLRTCEKRREAIDRAAQILKIMVLAASALDHPVHHDLRGSPIGTDG